MENSPLVSIIIPTYNSYNNLKILLDSFKDSNYKNFEIIINDDKRTNDNTEKLVNDYNFKIIYVRENLKMAQARKKWFEFSTWEIIIHMDSDMKITKNLLKEVSIMMNNYDALVVPEESYWTTFWARCKWLEKRCYDWNNNIESLRVIKREVYESVWWHNEKMIFSEDKDFDLRVRKKWYKIWRLVENFFWHNEWDLKLLKTLNKKRWYSNTSNLFELEHPEHYRWQINIFNRYLIYLKNYKLFFKYPLIYVWMIFMKTLEFWSGALGLVTKKFFK